MKFTFLRGLFCDLRTPSLLVPALAVLALDLPVMLTLLYSLSAMLVIVAMAHLVRRVLFPHLDLSAACERASETPSGAGLVFLGVSILLSAVVIGTALWIAK